MKFRRPPVAAAITVVALAVPLAGPLAGLAPAYADVPAAPNLTNVSTATAGHVVGVAESAAPFVFVGLAADHSDAVRLDSSAGSAPFDLLTWGWADATVHAWACPSDVLDPTCSDTATLDAGAPTDVTLADGDPVWSADDTVGPATLATVTIADATGGGDLVATWTPSAGDPVDTALTRGSDPNQLNLTDGDGTVTLERCSHATPSQCVPLQPAASKTFHVHRVLAVSASSPAAWTTSHASSSVDVHTDLGGAFTVHLHLENAAAPGVEVPGTALASPVTGTLGDTGATGPIGLQAPTSVPDGTYRVVGTIAVVNDDYGSYSPVPFTSGTFTIHRTGPALTSVKASPSVIYPLLKGVSGYPTSTRFTIAGPGAAAVTSAKLYRSGAYVRDLSVVHSSSVTATWSGLVPGSTAAPAGVYTLKLADSSGNVAARTGSVTVSGKKLVLKTWARTVTAASTLSGSYVGRCSTLQSPALRGWYRSIGYYANTRCASKTSADSVISTSHSMILPSKGVVGYVDIRVNTYGGAAKDRPSSKARVRYLTTAGHWTSYRTLGPAVATHAGYAHSASGLLFSDHSFGWGFYTGFGYRYDVKSFTVVLHYKAVGF